MLGRTGTWAQAEGGKGGGGAVMGMAADAGTRRGAQRQAAEASRWRVRGDVQVERRFAPREVGSG